MTFAIRSLLVYPWPIGNASLLLGMAFVILVQRFLYLLSVLSEVWFLWKFHFVQTESHIPLIILWPLFQYVASAYDGVVGSVQLYLFCYHSSNGNTMCCWCIWMIHALRICGMVMSVTNCNIWINNTKSFYVWMVWNVTSVVSCGEVYGCGLCGLSEIIVSIPVVAAPIQMLWSRAASM